MNGCFTEETGRTGSFLIEAGARSPLRNRHEHKLRSSCECGCRTIRNDSNPQRGGESAQLVRWLKQHAREYNLIRVHAIFSHAPSFGMRIARRQAVPYINRPSGVLCRWPLRQSRIRKEVFLALFERASLDHAAALEFTAELEQTETADLRLKVPSFVLPYG